MTKSILTYLAQNLKDFSCKIQDDEHVKSEYQEELKDLDELIEKISAPLNIVMIGEFSTGKSTFINALLRKNVVKVAIMPTTAVITKLCYGEKDTITAYFKDGTKKQYTQAEFDDLTAAEDGKENAIHTKIDYVERKLPVEQLRKVTFIDTPGLNAIRPEDEKITRQFLNNADTILLMFDATQMNKKEEFHLLENLDERLKPIGIANKIDMYEEDEEEDDEPLEEYLAGNRRTLGDRVSQLIGISAKWALDGYLKHDVKLVEKSNIKAVEKAITESVLKNRDTYKINSLLNDIGNVFYSFGRKLNELQKKNKTANSHDYEKYISNQVKLSELMDRLGEVARPLYTYAQQNKDNAGCKMFLGILSYLGILVTKSIGDALRYWKESAAKNNAVAQLCLGEHYIDTKEWDKSLPYWQKLAENKIVEAQCALGAFYEHGLGVDVDLVKAGKYYRLAAEQGDKDAQYAVGRFYEYGGGVDIDLVKAGKYYRFAAEQGDADAQYALGRFYENGIGNTEQNYRKAFDWYSKAVQKNQIEAAIAIGRFYEYGIHVSVSMYEAEHYYKKAAESGEVLAQYCLVNLYRRKNTDEDNKKAFYWCNKAVATEQPEVENLLGLLYDEGIGTKKDSREAVKWYKKSAEGGYSWGAYNLAVSYSCGDGIEENDEKAFYWYKKAANADIAEAQMSVGECYDNGCGVEQDRNEAVRWYQKAAENGEGKAAYKLALAYESGVLKDNRKAFHWYQQAAKQNIIEARDKLGYCYEYGIGIKQDLYEAVKNYTEAAKAGLAWGQFHLGNFYRRYDTDEDNRKAFYWCEKAAKQNLPEAQNILGLLYEEGKGTKKDLVEAEKWYRKSAEQGYVWGQRNLAVLYACGRGVKENNRIAFYWYKKAAEQGNAEAQNYVGICYACGREVKKDDAIAFYWYQKSAEQNWGWGQYNLARYYKYGISVPKDEKMAFSLYEKAAKNNIQDAFYEVAISYDEGIGVAKNSDKAFYWYKMAADAGINKEAYYKLSLCYSHRKNPTGMDLENAFKWMKKAADENIVEAQYTVGCYYKDGIGVTKNKDLALEYWKKAAEKGHEKAKKKIDEESNDGCLGCSIGCFIIIIIVVFIISILSH